MKDRPPQQIARLCGSCIIAPITSGSFNNPSFYRGTTCLRRWALRATLPLLSQQGRREPAYLYGSFSPVNSRCADLPFLDGYNIPVDIIVSPVASSYYTSKHKTCRIVQVYEKLEA
ncbi:hypothetical protein AVEN_131949-1 [Araneus ventricosus]|uniref:Uncharacterized protein n=1 Tax=Araneus ventricosus TaxID=182803 RepID=A0A4Y2B1K6_ARAVE|nr:hypothetical protein AVEN_131949-1 [Araneus ventricosus]